MPAIDTSGEVIDTSAYAGSGIIMPAISGPGRFIAPDFGFDSSMGTLGFLFLMMQFSNKGKEEDEDEGIIKRLKSMLRGE